MHEGEAGDRRFVREGAAQARLVELVAAESRQELAVSAAEVDQQAVLRHVALPIAPRKALGRPNELVQGPSRLG